MSPPSLPIEDEYAIRSLFARYGHLADAGDPAFGNLFTEDGSWTRLNSGSAAAGGTGLPPETIRGRAEIVRKMIVETVQGTFKRLLRHQITDFYVEPARTPDRAVGHARALITDWRDGPGRIAMFATYTATFAKVEGGWLIESMECALLPE